MRTGALGAAVIGWQKMKGGRRKMSDKEEIVFVKAGLHGKTGPGNPGKSSGKDTKDEGRKPDDRI